MSAYGRDAYASVPFTRLIGLEREFSEGGRARFVLPPRPELENRVQSTHGGVVATLLDVAMAGAAVSQRDFACPVVTLDMHCQYLRPGRGRLTADGEVVAVDGETALCRARVRDPEGEIVAQAQGSFRYLPRR
jgi:acyl-CoA thioesterase